MQSRRRKALAVLAVCVCVSWAAPARAADAVIDWNAIAADAVAAAIAAGRAGQGTTIDLAKVHLAIFDAVEAIEKRFTPYHVHIPHAKGSRTAATAQAAHDVLVSLYPSQKASLDTKYQNYLTDHHIAMDDPGLLVGQQAAAGILALRANDGAYPAVPPPPFVGGTGPGEWRPTPSFNLPPGAPPGTAPGPPPSFAPMAVVWLGTVMPFALDTQSQFRADPRPPLTSPEYTRAYNEVKAFGELSSTTRTAEQTDLGYFFADNFVLIWNRALQSIATAHIHRIGDSARLFALAYIAAADSGITAWDSKKFFNFWRPITAVREGDNDGNSQTVGDPNWKPLINTPNYPDYTSGANALTGSMTKTLALFFGRDKMTFSLTSNYPLAVQKTRTYKRFSDAAQDVVDVRVLQGIHFRFADVAARRQGRQVAKWAFKHFLRPIHDDDDDDDDGGHHHGHDRDDDRQD